MWTTLAYKSDAVTSTLCAFELKRRYAILSPYSNGNTTGNHRGRSQFGQMVAVDLQDFTAESVSVVDLAYTRRQQARIATPLPYIT